MKRACLGVLASARFHFANTPALTQPHFRTVVVAVITLAAVLASVAVFPGVQGLLGAGLAILMAAIAVTDARHFIIPDKLTAVALGVGFIHAVAREPASAAAALAACALRGAALAFVFWGLRALYRWVRGREGIGLGDVKLAGVAGAWLDWRTMPLAIEIAALAAIGFYVMRHLLAGQPLRATGRVPFGLFLAPAIWIGWFFEALVDAW